MQIVNCKILLFFNFLMASFSTLATVDPDQLIGSSTIFFKDRYLILGGSLPNDSIIPFSIWSSKDAIEWTEIKHNFPLSNLSWFSTFVIEDNLYIVGGSKDNKYSNLIFSTKNLIDWKIKKALFPVKLRYATTHKFKNNIYIIGGEISNKKKSPLIYTSSDGLTWKIETTIPQQILSENSANLIFQSKLFFLLASHNNKTASYSYDFMKKKWLRLPTENPPSPRIRHAAFTLNNKIHLFGGESVDENKNSKVLSDLWRLDNNKWTQIKLPPIMGRLHTNIIKLKNQVTFIGGESIPLKLDKYQLTIKNNYMIKKNALSFGEK